MSGDGPPQAAGRELPTDFPIFPLTGALLLPHGRLPLNMFEPRYLALTEDALANGRHIGMIQPDPAQPRGQTGPGLHKVGCLGRLISFAETEDGRYLITLAGLSRFTIAEELPVHRGYRRARADFSRFPADPGPALSSRPLDRTMLFDALRDYFDRRHAELNWEALDHMSDSVLTATLCMACPFEPMEKQALLEAADEEARVATLYALLRIDGHAAPAGPAS